MKVYLGASTLAAGDREGASGFEIKGTRAVQSVEYVRGTYRGAFGRGNKQNVIRFSVARIHADLETAMEYVLDHEASLPESGLLHIETNAGGGDRWIEDAVLVDVALDQFAGTHTRHTYTLVGGEVLDEDPTPP